MKFVAHKMAFGARPRGDDEDDLDAGGLPAPVIAKLKARRAAGFKEATAILDVMPGPGEALHAVTTTRFGLTDLLDALLARFGKVERMLCATLGYNHKNLVCMCRWLDTGAVGSLTLLASTLLRAHKGDLWEKSVEEFHKRGQRLACACAHAKVICLMMANGAKLVIEGSANLCGSGSTQVLEQVCIINDASIHDWHSTWILDWVARCEGKEQPIKKMEEMLF